MSRGSAPDFPLNTQRLSLSPHHERDFQRLLEIYERPDVARYLLDDPWTGAVAQEKVDDRLRQTDLDNKTGALSLVVEREGRVIGDVLLWYTDREHRIAEIGWVMDPAERGQGYATEAVGAVLKLAFEHYRVHRVAAQMDARNTASEKLAERVGMVREAHLRQNWWSKGEWTDTVICGMLAADHRA